MKNDKPTTSDSKKRHMALVDGSRLITESCVRAGADAYVGYPITPANLLYTYAGRRFPMVLPAPDEISSLQWMAGLSAAGRLPVTATSFPGFALMVESINLAYMMELPLLVVLVQRLGPAIGTATGGAQGDLFLQHGMISGGYPVPVFCISDMNDCWRLPPIALRTAVELRTPVVLLTSKEMAMTEVSFDLSTLEEIKPIQRVFYDSEEPYRPYAPDEKLVPAFLPVGNDRHQVRLTGSTHNAWGILQFSTDEALANTRRLPEKIEKGTPALYHLDEQEGAETLVMTHGITTGPAREAVESLRAGGVAVSLLVARTLLPVPDVYYDILDRYPRIVAAEENLQGQLAHLLFGQRLPSKLKVIGGIGRMIPPDRIVEEVKGG